MAGIARSRLIAGFLSFMSLSPTAFHVSLSLSFSTERTMFRKERPLGFHAGPEKNPDGTWNLFKWNCCIPGKEGSPWEGGVYRMTMGLRCYSSG